MYNDSIQNEYFNWLCRKAIDNPKERDNLSKLLEKLYSLQFLPVMEQDFNRWNDGADLKYHFAWDYSYSYDTVDNEIIRQCTILDLMVSLACMIEDRYMAEMNGISQVSRWFMQMLDSLDLAEYTNDYFQEEEIERKVKRFNNREYDRDGHGGLFTIMYPQEDQRYVDIWRQLTTKCSEMLEDLLK